MAIFQIWEDGEYREVIQESPQFKYKPKGNKFVNVQRLTYKHEHSWMPPSLIVNNGKKYIIPNWVEVHPKTKLSDIRWERPKVEVKQPEMVTKTFTSKSNPDITYEARKVTLPTGEITYSCSCPGVWRAKDRKCRHIKDLES
jgi:hypothetical protein